MSYQDFAKFNVYELGDKTACNTIVDDLLGHMTATPATVSGNVHVGSAVTLVFDLPSAGATYVMQLPNSHNLRVVSANAIKVAAGGGTDGVTIRNGSNAICAVALTGAADAVAASGAIDVTHNTIAAGGTLQLVVVSSNAAQCQLYVNCVITA